MEDLMKHRIRALPVLSLGVAFGLLLVSAPSLAGSNPGKSTARTSASYWMFNPTTMETVQGKVTGVTTQKAKKAKVRTEWLSLQTDHGTMPVLLGPATYVRKEKMKINKGDEVSVTGSRVTRNKKAELVATEIKRGDETLDLRKPDGTPLWSSMAMQGK
jgi:hypothetical protein